MIVGKWRFAPHILPTLVTFLLLPVFVSLAVWQLDRAQLKTDRHDAYLQALDAAPIDINVDRFLRQSATAMDWKSVVVDGYFENDIQLLFDNRVVNRQAGYYVYTPFRLKGQNQFVLINRGWVSSESSRSYVPRIQKVSERVSITGIAKQPQSAGIKLNGAFPEELEPGTYRMQSIDIHEISDLLKLPLLPYVIRLEPGEPYGFTRNWAKPTDGSAKHRGYAYQWFAMAAALLVIFVVVNTKKIESE